MATYAAFLRESQRRQRRYIEGERTRMQHAADLFRIYQEAMQRLGLQPLGWNEISDRQAELKQMLGEIESTHGDSDGMRAAYELNEGNLALPRLGTPADLGCEVL